MGQVAFAERPACNAGESPRFVGTRFEETILGNGDSEFIFYLDTPDGRVVEMCVVTMPTQATRMREQICVRSGCWRRAQSLV
jgi:hypothetical protein